MSLALASKPQVLENCLVLGSRTALIFELLKFCRLMKKFLKTFIFGERLKKILKPFFSFFFFGEHLRLCPLSLAWSIPVLNLERVCSWKSCLWPWPRIFFESLALALSLVSPTPPLVINFQNKNKPVSINAAANRNEHIL